MFKNQLCSGLIVVKKCFSQKNETLFRSHQISNSELCRRILGVDANSLNHFSVAQENPTGFCVRYRETQDFKPDPCNKSGYHGLCWLKSVKKSENVTVQHKSNVGKKRPTNKHLPVDGYFETDSDKIVLEYLRCFWHAYEDCLRKRYCGRDLPLIHLVRKVEWETVRQQTIETKTLQMTGYVVREIRGCDWQKLKEQNLEIASFIKTVRCAAQRRILTFEKILQGVKNGDLFVFFIA